MKKHFHQFTFLEYKKVLSMNQENFFLYFLSFFISKFNLFETSCIERIKDS